MRITTRAVYQMTDDGFIELERDSYDYGGPVSLAGGGGDDVTQTSEPWGPLKGPIKSTALPAYQAAALNPAPSYPGNTVAPITGTQLNSMNRDVAYAQGDQLNNAINNQFGALNFGLNSVYDPKSNPVINKYVKSATRPLTQAYQEAVGNTLTGNAVGAGGLGGSRQGVAEGAATRSYLDAVEDTSTNIYNNAYNSGLDQQARMLALGPQTMQAGMMPSQLIGNVGNFQQGQNQREIDANVNRYNYDSNIEWERARDYFNSLMGNGFGTTTGPNPNQSSPAAGALGGASAGAALGTQLYPGWGTAIGAVGGGLIGAFS